MKVEFDLEEFEKQCDFKSNCVLVFPPLNSYRRFLIHKLCEKFSSLGSFSISQGYDRRIVIYSRTNLHPNREVANLSACEERHSEKSQHSKNENYLRFNKSHNQAITSTTMGIKDLDALAKTIKPFRQDICQTATLNTWTDNGVPSSSVAPIQSKTIENQSNSNQRQRQRRPDRAVYVPRGRRSQTAPRSAPTSNSGSVPKAQVFDKESANVILDTNSTTTPEQNGCDLTDRAEPINTLKESNILEPKLNIASSNSSKPQQQINQTEKSPLPSTQSVSSPTFDCSSETMDNANNKNASGKIETALKSNDKDYNEEKEFQRASKEINRRNRRIIKQTFDSDVLEINEAPSVPKKSLPATAATTTIASAESDLPKKSKLPQTELHSNAKNSTAKAKVAEKSNDKMAVNADTDDWESIFDDNGECLDPKLMTEITANVGKVTIAKPKNDYKSYQEPINLDEEEFPHVLEVSNFPIEFKTQDLMMIFSEYKDLGFDIKWVDDTHALVVFSSSKIAARALNTGHAFVKMKPLTQATAESRARAKKSSLFLQPYRQRPETCAALARRLVTGALGVRLSTAKEEREVERRVLKEAKERKLLAAKMRDEAWEN